MGNTHAILLICHSSISFCCQFRHLIWCICSTPPAVCPSCWWERTPGRTDSSLKDTDSITEPNKDRHSDQNSITFKDERGMFAGESHHTFRFFNASCWSVRAYERLNFTDSYWWRIIPLTRHRENGECQSSHILQQRGIQKENEHLSTSDNNRLRNHRTSHLIDLLSNGGSFSRLDLTL